MTSFFGTILFVSGEWSTTSLISSTTAAIARASNTTILPGRCRGTIIKPTASWVYVICLDRWILVIYYIIIVITSIWIVFFKRKINVHWSIVLSVVCNYWACVFNGSIRITSITIIIMMTVRIILTLISFVILIAENLLNHYELFMLLKREKLDV